MGGPRAERRGTDAGAGGVGDRPRSGSWAGAAGPRIPVALDGRALSGTTGAVLDPIVSLRQRDPAGARRLRAPVLCHRDGLEPRGRAGARPQVPRPERGGAHLRAGLHPGAEHAAAPGHLERRGPALRTPRLPRPLHRRARSRAAPDALAGNGAGAARASGRTASRATCPSSWCAWSRRTTSRWSARCCRPRSTGGSRGCSADVVILNEHPVSYLDEMHVQLGVVLDTGPWGAWKHRPGGVFLLRGGPDERGRAPPALERGARGPERRSGHADGPAGPALRRAATGSRDRRAPGGAASPSTTAVRSRCPRSPSATGSGGFADDGREYVVVLDGDAETPLPWVNVIANPGFGTVVSASGSAYTWAENSRENRLTPFANDPVSDPTGEALFLRDEETGDVWSPTPGPIPRTGDSGRFVVRHAAGVSRFHARLARDRAGARGLRGRQRSGQVLAPHPDQPQRPHRAG